MSNEESDEDIDDVPEDIKCHAIQTLRSLNRCRKEGLECDVSIIVGNETFLAHRFLLAAGSKYFGDRLSEDKKHQTIWIENTKPEIIKQCLDFIYTGLIEVDEKNAGPLWAAGSMLQLSKVVNRTIEFLMKSMNGEICLSARELAIEHNCPNLKETSDNYGRENFKEICNQEEFLRLGKDDVIFFLKSKKNRQHPPPILYEAIVKWVHADFDVRADYFTEFLEFIKLNTFSTAYLSSTIRSEPLFRRSNESRVMLENELLARLSKKEVNTAVVIFDSISNSVKAYNWETRNCCDLPTLEPDFMKECSALVMREYIYVLSGTTGFRLNCSCRIGGWSRIANLSVKRATKIKPAALDECIYVVGGHLDGENSPTSACEYYDPFDNVWSRMRDVPTARDGHCLVGCGGFLYCIGGFEDEYLLCDTIERFDPHMGVWHLLENKMNTPRMNAATLAHNGKIYVIGGEIKPNICTDSVEIYDPLSDVWTLLQERLAAPRSVFSVGLVRGKIFVVGGVDTEEKTGVVSMETMNFENDIWSYHDKINVGKLEAAVVAEL